MRRFSLLFVAVFLGAVSLFAVEKIVTITATDALWTSTIEEQEGIKDGVRILTTNGSLNENYRVNRYMTFTVSVAEGNITAIEFTCTASGTNQYGPGCFKKITGYSYSGTKGLWKGSATSVSLEASLSQVRMTEIKVTVDVPEVTVASPTISPATGIVFTASQLVTITPAEDSHTVWYTIDGSDPVVGEGTSVEYIEPFTIDATTMVKAVATDGVKVSPVASAEFTKVNAVDGLSALVGQIKTDNSESDSKYYVNLTGAVVTGVSGSNAYLEEGTAGIKLYKSGHGLNVGDKYSGLATVTAKMYNGLPELTSFECRLAESNVELPLTTVTLSTLEADYDTYLSRRIKVEGATVTSAFASRNGEISQAGATMSVYAQGGNDIVMSDDDVIDIIAFPSIYNEVHQLNVLAKEDIVVVKAAPVLYFSANAVSVRMGNEIEEPVLTNTYGIAAEYTSSNTDVATVDAVTGDVTIIGEGETTITATLPDIGKSASYTLTVTKAITKRSGYYYQVTSDDELVEGARYLIAYKDNSAVMGAQYKTEYRLSVDASGKFVEENGLSAISALVDGACEIILEKGTKDNTWSFKSSEGYLYANSSKDNTMATKSTLDNNASATIAIDGGNASIVFQGKNTKNNLRYYPVASSSRFSCYGSNTTARLVQLYKFYTEFTIGADGYATFYTDKAFVMPEGVEGGIITETVGNKLIIAYNYPAGSIVPAGTALLLKAAAGNYAYELAISQETAPTNNLLHGADAVGTDGKTYVEGSNVRYYVLSKKAGVFGFYYAATDGAPIKYQAGRAFLAVESVAGAREFFGFEDIETGIDNVEGTTQVENVKIYTPAGVYVGTNMRALPKGIYIVDGKKIAF